MATSSKLREKLSHAAPTPDEGIDDAAIKAQVEKDADHALSLVMASLLNRSEDDSNTVSSDLSVH